MIKSEGYIADEGYIVLPLNIGRELPPHLVHDGAHFEIKHEFHVSILSYHDFPELVQDKVKEEFSKFAVDHPIEFSDWSDEYRLVKKDSQQSIIQMCHVTNLKKFIDHLDEKLHLEIARPPSHVTLYVSNSERGIGINSQAELERFSEVIERPFKET